MKHSALSELGEWLEYGVNLRKTVMNCSQGMLIFTLRPLQKAKKQMRKVGKRRFGA
jgi:hypothetical protein